MSDTSDSSSEREPDVPSAAPDGADREERDEAFLTQASNLVKTLKQGVVVTGERVHETIEDAVRRGRMTRKDAQELAAAIVSASRRQTDELRHELELLLERGRAGAGTAKAKPKASAAKAAPKASAAKAKPATPTSKPKAAPFAGYDDLTAVEVGKRLAGLSAAELAAVRGYEAAHAKRKTVLAAVDRRLAA